MKGVTGMPTRRRKESRTGIYHIIVRGINHEKIFQQQREKLYFKSIISNYLQKYKVEVYSYCIMSNHAHFIIRAELQILSLFMAAILAEYASYYNFKHHRNGHVFQNRFTSECIEDEKGEKHLIFCVGVDLDDYHPEEAIKSVRPAEDDTSTGEEKGESNPEDEQGTENPIWDEPAKDGLEALFGSDDQPEDQTEGESAEDKPDEGQAVEPENKDTSKENKSSKKKGKK